MSQHFLLTAKARSLSLAKVARLSDEEAYQTFKLVRWAATDGAPVCPRCECVAVYTYATRKLFKCKACNHQFSVTSGTIFASRKLSIRDYLLAIAIFVNGAKGHSALQLSRDLDCQYKTAFVMAHKIREALASEANGATVSGEVEVDGAYFGGHVRPANYKANRIDRRLAEHQTGKRRVVVIMRERGGRTLPFVFKSEDASVVTIARTVATGSTVYADEATHWDALHARFLTKRINHSVSYSDGEACTNQAESFFSRLRRAEIGIHHHVAGPYLSAYASEMAWRENNRRVSNGEQYLMTTSAALIQALVRQVADRRDGSVGQGLPRYARTRLHRLRRSAEFLFGCVIAGLDCYDASDSADLTWSGHDEMDEASGDGWAELQADGSLTGEIFFHNGDESTFKAHPW